MEPRPYDMTNPEDLERWFREMASYLDVGQETGHDFCSLGTDFKGRKYAYEAFHKLKNNFMATLPIIKASIQKIK